jgi:hypothetical protein
VAAGSIAAAGGIHSDKELLPWLQEAGTFANGCRRNELLPWLQEAWRQGTFVVAAEIRLGLITGRDLPDRFRDPGYMTESCRLQRIPSPLPAQSCALLEKEYETIDSIFTLLLDRTLGRPSGKSALRKVCLATK